MQDLKSFLKTRKVALIISALYVGLGTLAICFIYGGDPLYGKWSYNTLLFTFPVTFFSFVYRYAEADYLLPVFVIQVIMFLYTFFILSIFIKKEES